MSKTVPIVATAVVAALAAGVYTLNRSSGESELTDSMDRVTATESESTEVSVNDTADAIDTSLSDRQELDANAELVDVQQPLESDADQGSQTLTSEAIDYARSLARGPLTDESVIASAAELKKDPALLAATLDEFAQETDPERLDRLRLLLGQLDDESMVAVAESMAFSGNPDSADAALDLLRDIGPRVPAARDIALNVLSSTQDPKLLVSATNVVASVGSNDPEVRGRVVQTLSSLVQHDEASVRRASFSTLARWSTDPSITPTLLQGLTDSDQSVRKSTAYGLIGYAHADASVVAALFQTAEDFNEHHRTRRGAVQALKGMDLDESMQERLKIAEASIN